MGELDEAISKVSGALDRQPLGYEEQRSSLARRAFLEKKLGRYAVGHDGEALGRDPALINQVVLLDGSSGRSRAWRADMKSAT